MIQDIAPDILDVVYENKAPGLHDICLIFRDDTVFVRKNGGMIVFPTYGMISSKVTQYTFLFELSGIKYYLTQGDGISIYGYSYEIVRTLRHAQPKSAVFALMTGFHLYTWYRSNRFCGKCGKELTHDENMRALNCLCGNQVFPRISPAVIVAVTDGDRILLTKYNGRAYKNYALIAGFVEIGETLEDTVRREVMEETGLNISRIKYYKSQPWGVDSNLLAGFFAKLDGDPYIDMDENELSVAEWVHRDDIEMESDGVSLTSEMIQVFKDSLIS